jgi:two-component system phosphate regulon response regulator PhoB
LNKILIVEDDEEIAELITIGLTKEGWSASHAEDAEHALRLIRENDFSACILDLMLPGMDGLSLLRSLRSMTDLKDMPIIIASAKDDDADVVSGLELGADDYIAKPFGIRVLTARLRAVMRRKDKISRPERSDSQTIEFAGMTLDNTRHELRINGSLVDMSATEFAILELFMQDPGRVFTREQIITNVKGPDYPVTDRAIDVHILSIRRKLGKFGSLIETVRGIGYKLRDQ